VTESVELLDTALHALDEIDRLVDGGPETYHASQDRQRALAYCWIAVGSALKDYTRLEGIGQGRPPLAAPIRLRDRLAHQALDHLDADLLWRTSTTHTTALRLVIATLRTSHGSPPATSRGSA
jgi:uncharacterized protein with HEPN domain